MLESLFTARKLRRFVLKILKILKSYGFKIKIRTFFRTGAVQQIYSTGIVV